MREISLTPLARRQFWAALRWWLEHRDKAPSAFSTDFSKAVEEIAANPVIGKFVQTRKGSVQRVFLKRVRYYIYYRVTTRDSIEIVAIWHASRGSTPRV